MKEFDSIAGKVAKRIGKSYSAVYAKSKKENNAEYELMELGYLAEQFGFTKDFFINNASQDPKIADKTIKIIEILQEK